MVLSFAAVSMAAVNVSADWRAEWQYQDTTGDDWAFSKYDLRFNFDGKVSDTIDAHLQIAYDNSVKDTDKDIIGITVKEYWATFKQSWGTLQAGTWDYKLIPSRVLIKPNGLNCINDKTMQFVATIPFGDTGLSAAFLVIPTDAPATLKWDAKLGYKADAWGVEGHYGYDDSQVSAKNNFWAVDAYYQINKDIKVFAFAVDSEGALKPKAWEDQTATAIGAQWKNIAGSKLTASLEYGITALGANLDNPIAAQFKYGFNNKLALEVEYTNYKDNAEDNIIIIRPRIAF
jgi:hypothetical protein